MPVTNLPYTYVVRKNGREYWRFRRGELKSALPGCPGEAAFHQRYAELKALSEAQPRQVEATSVEWLAKRYKVSAEFNALRSATRDDYEATIDLVIAELGDQPFRLVTTKMVKAVRDRYAATPRKAHKIKQMVSRLYSWAQEEELVKRGHNPAAGFKRLKTRTQIITPWSDFEIALFLRHAQPNLQLAVKLLLYTGQRCEDVATMQWHAFQGDTIRVRQSKTGEPLDIPCHSELRAVLEAVEIRRGVICRNASGKPYTANALRKAIHDACASIEGMPPHRSPHGLRYASAGALEEAGATVGQIVPVLGHRTYQMAMHYIMGRRSAAEGMSKLEQRA